MKRAASRRSGSSTARSRRRAAHASRPGPRRRGARHVLQGGIVLAGPEFEVLDPGYLVVEGGRITEIGAGRPGDRSGVVLDARQGIIAPAFINAHTHVSDGIIKEVGFGRDYWDVIMPPDGVRHRALRRTTPEAVARAMGDTLDCMVASGTLTFVDFREGGRDGVQVLRRAAVGRPVRAVAMGRFGAYPPQPPEELERNAGRLTEAHAAEIEAILEVADGFSLVTANDLTDEALGQLGTVVRSRGRLLSVHAAEAPGYRTISVARTGRADVPRLLEHLRPDFVIHLTSATEDEIAAVAQASVPAVVCPRIQGVMGLGVPRFDWMLERGMLVALGTDNAMLCSPDLLRELEYSSRVVRALRTSATYPTARQLLQMVTVNPARILGRDRDVGSLDRGKLADVVVFDASSPNLRPVHDPVATLVNRADPRDIVAVLREGRVVHGRLSTASRISTPLPPLLATDESR
jgi:cytosine/adenosine deaminase-related metal-dependent hydrolase